MAGVCVCFVYGGGGELCLWFYCRQTELWTSAGVPIPAPAAASVILAPSRDAAGPPRSCLPTRANASPPRISLEAWATARRRPGDWVPTPLSFCLYFSSWKTRRGTFHLAFCGGSFGVRLAGACSWRACGERFYLMRANVDLDVTSAHVRSCHYP